MGSLNINNGRNRYKCASVAETIHQRNGMIFFYKKHIVMSIMKSSGLFGGMAQSCHSHGTNLSVGVAVFFSSNRI